MNALITGGPGLILISVGEHSDRPELITSGWVLIAAMWIISAIQDLK